MNTFTFLIFNGGAAVTAGTLTIVAALVFIGFATINRQWEKNPVTVTHVTVFALAWAIVMVIGAFHATVTQSIVGQRIVPDTTGQTEQQLVVIPDTEQFISTEGEKMFAAIDEGGDTTLLEIAAVQYEDIDLPTLRTDATCEEWVAPLIWGESGYICTNTYTAILPR